MKNLIFLLVVSFSINFVSAQINTESDPSLYQMGLATGAALANDCNNLNRVQMYNNTINGSFSSEYRNGVRDGWDANINACRGGFNTNTTGTGINAQIATWLCQNAELFCGDIPSTSGGQN